MAQYIFQDETTVCLVEALREYFATHRFAKDYIWSPDHVKRRIEIVDSWPDTSQDFPVITIETIPSGSGEPLGFGQALERVTKDGDDIGQYFGGRVTLDVNYQIRSYSKRETHRVSDILLFGLLRQIPDRVDATTFHNLLLDSLTVRIAGESQRPVSDNTVEYSRTLSHRWQSYWKDEVLYSPDILTYLTTAERDALTGGTMDVQFSAG